ncbi:MAG: glycosyltransferase [Candidatus Pacebacteria bacterium]|nr:glycosyltransferase [Candidatus Paceibacterota bacterium]
MRILHVFKDSIIERKHSFVGSTKDVRSRTEYFREKGIDVTELVIEKNRKGRDLTALDYLKKSDLCSYDAVLFEYLEYPRSLKYLKNKYPRLKLLVRSHNAEILHSLHYFLASVKYFRFRFAWRFLKKLIKTVGLDYLCAKYSTAVLTISEWERLNYWNHLVPSEKVFTVPFFLAKDYLPKNPVVGEKNYACVCLTSTIDKLTPLILDALYNYSRAVKSLNGNYDSWKFYITGDTCDAKLRANKRLINPRLSFTGFLKDPIEFLCKSRVMVFLSDYGFGFKTKILEAIMCKCFCLVTPRLHVRLPDEVKNYCIIVKPGIPGCFEKALKQCNMPFPSGNPNNLLKSKAFSAWEAIWAL